MSFDDIGRFARQTVNSILHNTLNVRTVDIFFNQSPDADSGGDRAIQGIQWQVNAQGFIIQRGTTAADGRIAMTVRGSSSTLELLFGGSVVAQYEVTVSTAALGGIATVQGQKERLRMLGYQIGHAGPNGDGVDANNNMAFERSVLDFQVDQGLVADHQGVPATPPPPPPPPNLDAATRGALTTRAGA